jgi:hypothetical protein
MAFLMLGSMGCNSCCELPYTVIPASISTGVTMNSRKFRPSFSELFAWVIARNRSLALILTLYRASPRKVKSEKRKQTSQTISHFLSPAHRDGGYCRQLVCVCVCVSVCVSVRPNFVSGAYLENR